MQRKQHLSHPALIPLWKSLEKDWVLQLTAKLAGLVIALVLLAIGLHTSIALLLVGIVLTILGSWIIYQHLFSKSELERLQDRFYDSPESVVWIYTFIHEHHPFGLQFTERGLIYFKFDDGDEITASLPPQRLKLTCKVLQRALPNTIFGYTPKRAAQYQKNPLTMSKDQS